MVYFWVANITYFLHKWLALEGRLWLLEKFSISRSADLICQNCGFCVSGFLWLISLYFTIRLLSRLFFSTNTFDQHSCFVVICWRIAALAVAFRLFFCPRHRLISSLTPTAVCSFCHSLFLLSLTTMPETISDVYLQFLIYDKNRQLATNSRY